MNIEKLLQDYYGRDAEPESFETLKADASSRKYHRVQMPAGFDPSSLIVMELPPDPFASDEVTDWPDPDELPFINMHRALRKRGVRVPEIYLDAVQDGAVLIEDLGSLLFREKAQSQGPEGLTAWYTAALNFLTGMQEAMTPLPDECMAAHRRFTEKMLRWELEHFVEYAIEELRGRRLEVALKKRLLTALDEVAERIYSIPPLFVHRDYQSRNLMVLHHEPQPSSLAVIDFQDALTGPRVYDLVSLLNDSYMILSDKLKQFFINRYADITGCSRDEINQEFHLVAMQRKMKDAGRFVYIDRVKKNPDFLKFVEVSFSRIRGSLDQLDGHEDLKAALAEADPEHFA